MEYNKDQNNYIKLKDLCIAKESINMCKPYIGKHTKYMSYSNSYIKMET